MPEYPKTPRNRVHQAASRARYDEETVHAIIDAVTFGHIAFIDGGQPVSLPLSHARDGKRILIHGSPQRRLFQHLREGGEVSMSFAMVDGLVATRSAFHHAQNYRSAVIFGHGKWIEDEQAKIEAFHLFLEKLIPGRWAEVRPPNAEELAVSVIAAIEIESASAKIRQTGAGESPEDRDIPGWHGVVPLALRADLPEGEGGELPPSIEAFYRRFNAS